MENLIKNIIEEMISKKGLFYSKDSLKKDLTELSELLTVKYDKRIELLTEKYEQQSNDDTERIKQLTTANNALLEEIKILKGGFTEGKCPVCGQVTKTYKRNIYFNMAKPLVDLYKKTINKQTDSEGYVSIHDIKYYANSGFSKLAMWGFIEAKVNKDKTKRTSGYWKITEKGKRFVEGKEKAVKYMLVRNGKVVGQKGNYLSISEIDKTFVYSKIFTK